MILFNKVSKRFANGHYALKNVSFKLKKAELVFLTGHSGAGKSTILKLIAHLDNVTSGDLYIDNQNITTLKPRQIPAYRRSIGIVPQNPQLLWEQTVFDNVALPLKILGTRDVETSKRVRASLDKVGLLAKERMNCLSLSTGEQQRVAIARALVNRPAIILADEPTGNLDPRLSKEIIHLFESFQDMGSTVLIATHNLTEISTLPYRILSLNQGCLISSFKEPA